MKAVLTAAIALSSFVFANEPIWKKEYDNFDALNSREIFNVWKKDFDRSYNNIEDEANHYVKFVLNLKMITEHNANKNFTYKMRLNQFGDLTGDEFRHYVHGDKGSCLKKNNDIITISTNPSSKINSNPNKNRKDKLNALPDSVDWTTKGVVTPVKNQGSCGSCWAFSATGSTECRVAIATGKLESLSEQQLVDCSSSEGNEGCNGGLMDDAFKYIEKNGGLCSETEYPYKGVDGTCQSSTCGTKYNDISSYSDVTSDDDTALATSVSTGCTSVAIEADQSSFQFYSSGILSGNCGTNLDHGVLAVGYGTDGSQEYWKVKNSWGTSWGEAGYVLICRNCNKNGAKGECGINMEPSYPVN